MPKDPQEFIRPEKFWRDLGLRANQVVVHLGSGAGFYLIPAAKIVGPKGKVVGLDILEGAVEEAINRAQRAGVAEIVSVDRVNLENDQGSNLPAYIADWTLVANILYQSDPVKIMTEARRITKRGGAIVVVEWDNISTPLGPPAEQRVAKEDILKIAELLHLKSTKEFHPSPYHYGLILAP